MRTPWGANSLWDSRAMLSEFHNERWGGQKFFLVLGRLKTEPERYAHMLEFLYVCMAVGYQGRYRIENNGRIKFERILADLSTQLERLREEPAETLTNPVRHISPRPIRYNRSFPFWGIALVALGLAAGIFLSFRLALNAPLQQVIEDLQIQASQTAATSTASADPQAPAGEGI